MAADANIEIRDTAHQTFDQYRSERRQDLVGHEHDMWVTFADMSEPDAPMVNQQIVGYCSSDEENHFGVSAKINGPMPESDSGRSKGLLLGASLS